MIISPSLTEELKQKHLDKYLNECWHNVVSVTEAIRISDELDKDDREDYVKTLENVSDIIEKIGFLCLNTNK